MPGTSSSFVLFFFCLFVCFFVVAVVFSDCTGCILFLLYCILQKLNMSRDHNVAIGLDFFHKERCSDTAKVILTKCHMES